LDKRKLIDTGFCFSLSSDRIFKERCCRIGSFGLDIGRFSRDFGFKNVFSWILVAYQSTSGTNVEWLSVLHKCKNALFPCYGYYRIDSKVPDNAYVDLRIDDIVGLRNAPV
jgi:hypothetical protein